MELRPTRQTCPRARSYLPRAKSYLPRSTILLFLSLILPSSSYAQITTSLPRKPRSPTTLSTSTVPSSTSTSLPSSTELRPRDASTTAASPSSTEASHAFNYYFLIIAAVVILVAFCVLYIGRQKKRKAALAQTRGQRALARDVEGWRSRFGVGRAGMGRAGVYHNTISDTETEDGLNERGEAPPPYVPGSKPPSIGSEELRRSSTSPSHGQGETVELRTMGGGTNPPEYHEQMNQGSADESAEITRPGPVVTASERFGSIRRLMSNT